MVGFLIGSCGAGMIDHDRLYALIGERIRSIRDAQTPRMSQEDLAQVLNLKRTSITNIESGQQRLTLEAIYRLCEHFGLEVSDLVPSISDVTHAEAQPFVVGGQAQQLGVKTARVLEQLRPLVKARR